MRRLAALLLTVTAATSVAWVGAAPALAQSPAELMACVRVAGDPDRLACFDRAMMKASPEARIAGEKRAADAAAATAAAATAATAKVQADAAAQREAFGAEGIADRKNRFALKSGEIEGVETAITELLTNTSGLGVFLLENGQMWKQVDTGRLPNARAGDKVTVTRNNFGGYRLNFVRQKGWVVVKRIR